jgi:hypothetical protein
MATTTTQPQPIVISAQQTTTTSVDRLPPLESFRCRVCHAQLFKATRALLEGLRADQVLQIKCKCKTMNCLMGA